MAHAIGTLDTGFVHGKTWHHMEQYVQLDRPVTFEEAHQVMCYPLKKCQLFLPEDDCFVKAWAIKRTDHNAILVPAVGARFNLLNNDVLLDFVKREFLDKFDGIEIESVGTLFDGATAFLNLKLDEYHISKDESPTVSRLMYANPLGRGKYRCCAHKVRIVCNNTLRAAEAQGAANKTLTMVSHTLNAKEQIAEHLINLAEVQLGLQQRREKLEFLATRFVDSVYVQEFLEKFYVVEEGASQTVTGNAVTRRQDIVRIFEGDQHLNSIAKTRYGLLQATTQHLGTYEGSSRSGMAAIEWDALDGKRADQKDEAFALLMT